MKLKNYLYAALCLMTILSGNLAYSMVLPPLSQLVPLSPSKDPALPESSPQKRARGIRISKEAAAKQENNGADEALVALATMASQPIAPAKKRKTEEPLSDQPVEKKLNWLEQGVTQQQKKELTPFPFLSSNLS